MSKPTTAVRLKARRPARRPSASRDILRGSLAQPVPYSGPARVNAGAFASRAAFAAVLLAGGIWSYWPTIANLIETWLRVADYSHGFLVLPLAALFLWVRRDRFPGLADSAPWTALALMALTLLIRHAGDAFFFTFLDAWSIIPWTAACVALVGGWPLLRWSWVAILFLPFMVPLPFSVETILTVPLQQIATAISTATLQFLGQPAFADGNVILFGDQRLEVAEACSGLRQFVFIAALTYAYVALISRPAWEKLLLVAAAAPIAIAANAARIVTTGLLFQWVPGEQAHEWIHDAAGWGMVLFAVAAFWLLLVYLRQLVKEELVMDMSAMVKQSRA
ncbi:MAG TPA: exosortase/archaeosortase family protein [Pirellulaceae bacterium]|nr:exosortase/archaeosortase family protein [Pirellulaceae bacterium]